MTNNAPKTREGLERSARPVSNKSSRRQRDVPAGKKILTIPLLVQVIGILHLSAFCAKAAAVASAVLTPAAAAAGATAPARGVAVVASPGKTLAAPPQGVGATTGRKERAAAAAPVAAPAIVSAVARGKRPREDDNVPRPRVAALSVVAPRDTPRRPALAHLRSTSHAATSAFVQPPGLSAGRAYHRQQLARGGRHRWSSRIVPQRVRVGVAAVSCRKRPLMMTAAAAAAAAAAAVAAAAFRLVIPGGDIGGIGPRSSLQGFSTAAAPAPREPAKEPGGSRNARGGMGSTHSISSSPLAVQKVVLSMLRWVLTAGWLGARGRAATVPGVPRRDDRGGCLPGLLAWMWWPFSGGVRSTRASSEGKGSSGSGRGGGERAQLKKNTNRSKAGGSSTALAPMTVQEVQYLYPRPQSTAYARPQSTGYPRPKVTVPTLLDLEVEETVEVVPPRHKRASSLSSSADENGDGNPLLSRFLCWFFAWMITGRAKQVDGLEVHVDARSNRDAMSGLLQSVAITFNHLELETLQISGGATMRITGLDLKVMTLLWRRFRSFKKPFEVAGSYVFTSADLASSPMVRRLVQNMMNATLRKLETVATDPLSLSKSLITIARVTAKRSRLVIEGDMVYDDVKVPFIYRTSIGVKGKGHVVFLKDPEVFWENVGGSLSLPLLPLQTFDIDIGDAARIESIRIVDGQVAVRARFVLSPIPPLVVAAMFKRAAFRYDVGERLSITFGNLVQNMRII